MSKRDIIGQGNEVPEPSVKEESLEGPSAKKRRTEDEIQRPETNVKSGASELETPKTASDQQRMEVDPKILEEAFKENGEMDKIENPEASTSQEKNKKPQKQQKKNATVAELPKNTPTRLPFMKNPTWRPPATTGEAVRECNNFVTQSQMRLRDYIYGVVNEGYELIRTIESNLTWREIFEFHTRNGVMFRHMNELLDLALNCTAPPAIKKRSSGRYWSNYSNHPNGGTYRNGGRRGNGGGGGYYYV